MVAMVATTAKKLHRVALGMVLVTAIGLLLGLFTQSIVLIVLVVASVAIMGARLARCPRCSANAFREETSFGTVYNVLNSQCYKCGLRFNRPYSPAASNGDTLEKSEWDSCRQEAALVVERRKWTVPCMIGRVCLTGAALVVGYFNLQAMLSPGSTWVQTLVVWVVTSALYGMWLIIVLNVVRLVERRHKSRC